MKSWEQRYSEGLECNVAPFDEVISFVYRFKPSMPHQHIKILEVGCGVGNNINFLAQQGFQTFGIDSSPTAVSHARRGFSKVSQGNFTALLWAAASFHMVIDRASLSFATPPDREKAIEEIHRVLVPKGMFLFTPYAMPEVNDGFFFEEFEDVYKLLPAHMWRIIRAERAETRNAFSGNIVAHWIIAAEKNP